MFGYQLLHHGAIAIAKVEANGFRIDTEKLDRSLATIEGDIALAKSEIQSDKIWKLWRKRFPDKCNINSREQLGVVLFDVMGLECHQRTATGKYSTDIDELAKVDHPFVGLYVRYAGLGKLASTYLRGIKRETVNGYLHPSFKLHSTATYRSSSEMPNFQNLPIRDPVKGKWIRDVFIPRDGCRIVELDYSGIEVKIAACYHHDPTMLTYLKDPTKDMHRDMAADCYMIRPDQVSKKARYCNPVEAPIWMGDLSFRPIGEVKVGDYVMGWHRKDNARKGLLKSKVLAIHRHNSPVVKVTMASGRVIRCSPDHFWLSGKTKGFRSEGQKEAFVNPEVGRVLCRVVDPVGKCPPNLVRKAGWLGGILDGEGTGMNWCRPVKQKRIRKSIRSRSSFYRNDEIVSVVPDGNEVVIGMTTETGNYVAWGYASKNCAKNMFVFPQFYGSYYPDCAKHLYRAIDSLGLKIEGAETSIKDHLAKKGIASMGKCDHDRKRTPTPGTFEHHIQSVERHFWKKRFPVYAEWKRTWFNDYTRRGYFDTLTGFRIRGEMRRNEVINYPVQGSAFHCLLWSLIELQRLIEYNGMKTLAVGQIHDSIVLDVPDRELKKVLRLTKHVMGTRLLKAYSWINVPIEIEAEVTPVNGSWFEKAPHALE
jgi:hypothetical protein